MSRMQSFLQAYPAGSVVTRALLQDHRELGRRQLTQGQDEIRLAKQIQAKTNCNWGTALRAAVKHLNS